MPLDPQVERLLDELIASGRSSSMSLPLEEGRRNFNELFASLAATQSVAAVRDLSIPGPEGEVPIRTYTPEGAGPFPLIVFAHGGGWVFGGIDSHDGLCRQLANAAGAVVVGVGYRLAPEHPFPAGLEDCYAVLQWAHAHAADLDSDDRALVVAGDSSGGTLAAAAALLARDRGGPPLAFQLLAFPALDSSLSTKSYEENAEDPFLSKAEMIWYWERYATSAEDRLNPYASPAQAEDLRGLAPAYVMTAEFDPLRDEGRAYAAKLRHFDVPVTLAHYEGMVHDFVVLGRAVDAAREAIRSAGRAIAHRLVEARG
jgi:acetyl esterase